MKETYTGASYSWNKLKGNFHWPGQEHRDKTSFDRLQPHYVVKLLHNEICIYFCLRSTSLFINGDTHLIIQRKIRSLSMSEWMLFRTQADIAEFLEINQLLLKN